MIRPRWIAWKCLIHFNPDISFQQVRSAKVSAPEQVDSHCLHKRAPTFSITAILLCFLSCFGKDMCFTCNFKLQWHRIIYHSTKNIFRYHLYDRINREHLTWTAWTNYIAPSAFTSNSSGTDTAPCNNIRYCYLCYMTESILSGFTQVSNES